MHILVEFKQCTWKTGVSQQFLQHTARIFIGKKAKKFFFSVYSHTADWLAMTCCSPQLYPACTARLLLASPVAAGRTLSQPGNSWFSPSSHIKFFESPAGHLKVFPPLSITRIQNLCVVRGGINGGSPISTYRLPACMTCMQPGSLVSCPAARRMASRTLVCKSWKGVAARVHDGSNFAEGREKRMEICPVRRLYITVI